LIKPFIKEFSLTSGRQLKTLVVPSKFCRMPPVSAASVTISFESLTITPDQYLFTATENALIQDVLTLHKEAVAAPDFAIQLAHQPVGSGISLLN